MIASDDNFTRRKRVVYLPVQCPYCQRTEVIKAGKQATGAQRYQCQNDRCERRSFLLQYRDRGRVLEIRRQVIDLALNGSGIRRHRSWVADQSHDGDRCIKKKLPRFATSTPRCYPRSAQSR